MYQFSIWVKRAFIVIYEGFLAIILLNLRKENIYVRI